MADKAIVRVLECLRLAGPQHCHQIAARLGITPQAASTWLHELKSCGTIVQTGTQRVKPRGPPAGIFAIVGGK